MGATRKQAWGKIIIEVHRTLAFLFMCYSFFLFLRFFSNIFFIFFSFAEAHKKKKHQVSDFLCNDVSSGISTSLP
jgi:hypothetical protein